MLLSILYRLSDMYHERPVRNKSSLNRGEDICKAFGNLVIQHYTQERNISYYAQPLKHNAFPPEQYRKTYHREDRHGYHFRSGHC